MRLKSLLIPLVGLAIAFGVTAASASSLDDIIARKKVMIGVDLSVPPFGVTNEQMQPDGLDVDVAKLLAKDLGVQLELVRRWASWCAIISLLTAQASPFCPPFCKEIAMKAVVIHAARDLRVEDREIEALQPGQVEVAIEAGAICGSDLH